MTEPRGFRNCNPLNIVHTAAKWQGMADVQSDPNFVRFKAMRYGFRAAFLVLKSYKAKGIVSVRDIIHRWCPDATADSYTKTVCARTHWSADKVVDVLDPVEACQLAQAMCVVENGFPADPIDVEIGWKLAFD